MAASKAWPKNNFLFRCGQFLDRATLVVYLGCFHYPGGYPRPQLQVMRYELGRFAAFLLDRITPVNL